MNVVKAPDPFKGAAHEPIVIFLAGSIEMGRAENWQTKVEKFLSPYLGVILNPRRDDWDSSWVQSIENKQFTEQVRWEQSAMEWSDVIFMYFDPKTQSPITLLEFGQYVKTDKLIVCCPQGFWRRGNLEVMCNDNDVPLYDNLDDALDALRERVETFSAS